MRKDIIASADIQSNSNEENQKYYEWLAIEAMMIREQSQNTFVETLAKRKAEVRVELLLKGGISFYTLTPTGFVKKR